MDSEKKKDFVARISQANRSQLTVVIFDIIIEEITCAIDNKKSGGEPEVYEKSLKMARNFVGELIDSLDFKYSISRELMPIYVFVNREIIYALLSDNEKKLSPIIDILKQLRESFETISHQDFSEPLMENTQKIYAGLTYGKGQLNEISVDVNQVRRGYKI